MDAYSFQLLDPDPEIKNFPSSLKILGQNIIEMFFFLLATAVAIAVALTEPCLVE